MFVVLNITFFQNYSFYIQGYSFEDIYLSNPIHPSVSEEHLCCSFAKSSELGTCFQLCEAIRNSGKVHLFHQKVIILKCTSSSLPFYVGKLAFLPTKMITVSLDVYFISQVTDFGLSITKSGVGHDNMMQDFCGTPNYMGKS